MPKTKETTAYQLKITLKYIKPPIWRRVVVPASIKLDKLHNVIMIAMGWSNSHLHTFEAKGVIYSVPHPDWFEEVTDEAKVSLNQILQAEKQKFLHSYDFGDGWEHTIALEKIITGDATLTTPHCLAGKRACPPEDCGGIPWFL